jgi:hypothetical protein
MDRVDVGIEGLKETQLQLAKTTAQLRKALMGILKPSADVLKKGAQQRVRKKTGNVSRNITVKVIKSSKSYVRLKVTLKPQGAEGFPLEVGHVMSGSFAHFGGTVPAYPFMRPTFEAMGKNEEGAILRRLSQRVERK